MTLLQTSLRGGLLILALALFRAVFFRLLPKKLLPRLWLGAVLMLLCPVPIESSLSIYGLLPAMEGHGALPRFPLPLWLSVGLLLALVLAALYLLGLRRFRLAEPVEDGRVSSWLALHPLWRRLRVKRDPRLKRPLSGGLLRPVILLPAGAERLPDPALHCVLEHEWAHVRGLHALYKLLLAAALCLHWFNPAVWLLCLLAGRDLEFAADEAVLEAGVPRAAYARLLLETAAGGRLPFQSAFGGGARRVKAVLQGKRPGRTAGICFGLLGLALLFAFATVPAAAPAPAPVSLAAPAETLPPPLPIAEEAEPVLTETAEVPAPLRAEKARALEPIFSVRQVEKTFYFRDAETLANEEEALLYALKLELDYTEEGSYYLALVGDVPALPPVLQKEYQRQLDGLTETEPQLLEMKIADHEFWFIMGRRESLEEG